LEKNQKIFYIFLVLFNLWLSEKSRVFRGIFWYLSKRNW